MSSSSEKHELELHERGSPVPPGEPTALNKERAGHRRLRASARSRARESKRLLVAPNRIERQVVTMANVSESAQGPSRANRPKGLTGLDQKVRWQETRASDRVSRSSITRSTSWRLKSRTPNAELGNPVVSPFEARTRSSLPAGGLEPNGQSRSGSIESWLGKPTARKAHGAAGQDAGRSEC